MQLKIVPSAAEEAIINDMNIYRKSQINKVLKTLSYREREIIKLRYGLVDGYVYTLEEIGYIFKVTRERIRQVENKAINKMQQHPRIGELMKCNT